MTTNHQRHNFFLGLIGALLGALGGAIIYFIVTKIGYIAYISSVAGVYFSITLYTKFAGRFHWAAIPACILINIAALLLVDTYIISDYIIKMPEYRAYGYTLKETIPFVIQRFFAGELFSAYVNSLISSAICLVMGLIFGIGSLYDPKKNKDVPVSESTAPVNAEEAMPDESSLKENEAYRNDRYDSEEDNSNSSMDSDLGSLDSKKDTSF